MEAVLNSEVAAPAPPGTDRWRAWDALLEATPETGFMQSSWWADFRATVGFEHFGAILKTPDGIVGGALVQKYSHADDECFYYVQDGPVLPADEEIGAEVFAAILEEINARRLADPQTVSHLRIEPRWARLPGFVTGFSEPPFRDCFHEPRNTLCIDLRPGEDEILAQMKPKGRYNIRVAERHGVKIVEDNSAQGLADFISIYEDTASRQGFGAKPAEYFEDLVAALWAANRGSLFFAEHQGTRLVAALMIRFGNRVTYFYGGSLLKDRHVMAPYLLHFEVMRRAKAMNLEWYDFWGIASESDPDSNWRDFTVFKRKFGGREVNLVPQLDLVYDPAAYRRYLDCHSGSR